ncbi:protein-tyrosine phosphatase-like protein [Pyrenochaeta sp. MPI-SDFR-AT-0127]|nr:protein-tyrosine phosphatase-like protein [Pyrenochaeta sp. MPI-SDFR-AT-0127]
MTNSTSSRGLLPLKGLLSIDMNTPIDPGIINEVLGSPPFVQIPNIINLRDLGLIPSSPIAAGLIFRSGAIHSASPTSITTLGVKLIVDLRSEREVQRDPTPAIDGIVNINIPSTEPPSPVNMADFTVDGGVKAYTAMYLEILSIYTPAFKAALRHLVNNQTPFLFHCTAGKDRTGVLAALLLSLAGASRDVIAHDYSLTRVGIEPSRELLLQMLRLWNKDWAPETPGMHEFVQVKSEFILGFLDAVQDIYGSVEAYVGDILGLTAEDIEIVKRVLTSAG